MKKKLIGMVMLVTLAAMQVMGVSAAGSKTTGMAVTGDSKTFYKTKGRTIFGDRKRKA